MCNLYSITTNQAAIINLFRGSIVARSTVHDRTARHRIAASTTGARPTKILGDTNMARAKR
jgi:hypothetical protein